MMPLAAMSDKDQRADLPNWILENLVHFSNKITNSNAPGGGVRLAAAQALNLPYVSARTHLHDLSTQKTGALIELDYVKPTNIRMKEVRVCLGEEVNGAPELDMSAVQMSQAAGVYLDAAAGQYPRRIADEKSPPLSRLKQVLLPVGDGEAYITATPLNSAGMAKLLNDCHANRYTRLEQLKSQVEAVDRAIKDSASEAEGGNASALLERRAELLKAQAAIRFIPRVRAFPYGGDKPQNVGSRVNEGLSRPFVFDQVPRENHDLKYAYRLLHRGLTLTLPKALIADYKAFLDKVSQTHEDAQVWRASIRTTEYAYLTPLWNSWENQARKARRVLDAYAASLPDRQVYAANPDDAFIQAGWLQLDQRSLEWRKQAARRFAIALSTARVGVGSGGVALRVALTPNDQDRIVKAVIGGFRE